MVRWVRFADRATGGEFYAINAHVEAFDPALPVILTGDFNEAAPCTPCWVRSWTRGRRTASAQRALAVPPASFAQAQSKRAAPAAIRIPPSTCESSSGSSQ
jgi:hypothetical protein